MVGGGLGEAEGSGGGEQQYRVKASNGRKMGV